MPDGNTIENKQYHNLVKELARHIRQDSSSKFIEFSGYYSLKDPDSGNTFPAAKLSESPYLKEALYYAIEKGWV